MSPDWLMIRSCFFLIIMIIDDKDSAAEWFNISLQRNCVSLLCQCARTFSRYQTLALF